jgi:hypothetical protein
MYVVMMIDYRRLISQEVYPPDEKIHDFYSEVILEMKKVWDRLGIAFSSACVIHCLLVAFFPFIFPTLSLFGHLNWIHSVVAVVILFTSPLAFIPGYRKHGLTWIVGVAIFGLGLIFLGVFLEGITSDQISHGLSILGSLTLVFSHAKNIQHSHRHRHECC